MASFSDGLFVMTGVQVDGFALWGTGDGVHDADEMTIQRSDDGVAWHTVTGFNGSSTAGKYTSNPPLLVVYGPIR